MHDDIAWMPATEMAAAIRAKKLSPVEVTRALLERIDAINPAINAYVPRHAATWRCEQAQAGRGRRHARRRARRRCTACPSRSRTSSTCRACRRRRARSSTRTTSRTVGVLREAPDRVRRRRASRQDEHARVRLHPDDREQALRRDAQPVGHDAHARRLERRRRGRRGGGPRADRAQQRRRRQHPHPGVDLRRLRHQADVRPRAAASPAAAGRR